MSIEMSIFLFIFSLFNLFISLVNTFSISKLTNRVSDIEIEYKEYSEYSETSEYVSDSEYDSDVSEKSEKSIKLDDYKLD